MKSIEYIKNRIEEGTTNLGDCNFESMEEVSTIDICKQIFDEPDININNMICKSEDGVVYAKYSYDPNADFNYFTMASNRNDGTLLFDLQSVEDVISKVFSVQTYNTAILPEPPNEDFFKTHYFKYTMGDIVLCQEYGKEFSTKDKPWMTRRTTVMLPIKFEVIETK